MANTYRRSFYALLLGTLVSIPAFGGPETAGLIRVNVRTPLPPGLVVVGLLASEQAPHLSWSAEARGTAPLTFRHIPAGTYRLTIEVTGFTRASTEVSVAPLTSIHFAADLARIDQPNGQSQLRLVGADSSTYNRTFDQAMLASFPGDDVVLSVLETATAPVIVDRISNGGLWPADSVHAAANGTSWTHTTVARGEVDVTDPLEHGVQLMAANHASLESVVVSTSLLPPSVDGPGPLLTIVPRSPSTEWHGGALLGSTPGGLQSEVTDLNAPAIARFRTHREGVADIAGPAGSHGSVFLSTRMVSSERSERADPAHLSTTIASLFADTTFNTRNQERLRIASTIDRATAPDASRATFLERTSQERDTSMTADVGWERWTRGGTSWSATAAISHARTDVFGATANAGTIDRLVDGPVPFLVQPPGTRNRWLARIDVEPSLGSWDATHSWAAGGTIARARARMPRIAPRTVAERVGGLPARVWQYAWGGDSEWISSEVSGYVKDRITVTDGLRVDAGVRLDAANGSARAGGNSIGWLSASPRLSFRWSLGGERRFAVFGGYSHYSHRLPLQYFAFGDPSSGTASVYRWRDANGNGIFEGGEREDFIGAVGPCCTPAGLSLVDSHLQRPHTSELVGGINAGFGHWSLRIAATQRRERHQIGAINIGVRPDDYLTRDILDPGEPFLDPPEYRMLTVYDRRPSSFGRDRYLLTNTAQNTMDFRGAEITVDGAIASRFRTRFDGAVYAGEAIGANVGFGPHENDQGLLNAAFAGPNASTYDRGHPFFDRAYVIKWWNGYVAPDGLVLSAVARYQDGQPFSRMVVVPDLSQGPEAIQAYRRGATRFTFTLTVDTHVEKSFRAGGLEAAGIFEVFNLLNTANEVEENVVSGPAFRTPTAIQPPRAVRLAMRLAF